MLLKVIDFNGNHWRRDYRKIKKILRNEKVPFTIKKLPEYETLMHSLWVDDEYLDKAIVLVEAYYSKKPEILRKNARVKKLSKEFEEEWIFTLIAIFIYYPKKHPVYFGVILLVILAMVLFPII
jgi:hypothetical protein